MTESTSSSDPEGTLEPPPGGTKAGGPFRILVVDDDEDVLSVLGNGLSEAGYDVHVAASGNDAVSLLESDEGAFDLAVIDLVLPDTWGPQMAVAHSELQPEMKVIYISGHDQDDDVLRATTAQSKDVVFLSKPFSLDSLVELIRKQLGAPN